MCRALQNPRGPDTSMPVQRPGRVLSQKILAKSSVVDRWARTRHTGSVDGKKPLGWGKLCALETKAVKKKCHTFSEGGRLTHL